MGFVWGCVCPALIHVPHNGLVPLNISPAMAQHLALLYTAGTGAARALSSALPPWGGRALQHFGIGLRAAYGGPQPCLAQEGAVAISILPQGWQG